MAINYSTKGYVTVVIYIPQIIYKNLALKKISMKIFWLTFMESKLVLISNKLAYINKDFSHDI